MWSTPASVSCSRRKRTSRWRATRTPCEHPTSRSSAVIDFPVPSLAASPELAPDLVVEVLSPSDRPGEVLAKVADWLSAGTSLVWVIDPERRLARVYRHDGSETLVSANETLDGEDVVEEFSCPLTGIL